MRKTTCLWLVTAFACASSNTQAFCSAPSMYSQPPSSRGTYSRPSVPYCLSGYEFSGQHTCDDWEIENYIDEVNEYIRELAEYARKAQRFADDAAVFSGDALSYAECEAEAAKDAIE